MTSKTTFKIGDKVRYNKENKDSAAGNSHDKDKIYTISKVIEKGLDHELIAFEGINPGLVCFSYRLELVSSKESEKNTVKEKTYLWALVDKKTGKVQRAYPSRDHARLMKHVSDTVKKIEFTFVE